MLTISFSNKVYFIVDPIISEYFENDVFNESRLTKVNKEASQLIDLLSLFTDRFQNMHQSSIELIPKIMIQLDSIIRYKSSLIDLDNKLFFKKNKKTIQIAIEEIKIYEQIKFEYSRINWQELLDLNIKTKKTIEILEEGIVKGKIIQKEIEEKINEIQEFLDSSTLQFDETAKDNSISLSIRQIIKEVEAARDRYQIFQEDSALLTKTVAELNEESYLHQISNFAIENIRALITELTFNIKSFNIATSEYNSFLEHRRKWKWLFP
jgi:hypothetical protein